MELGKQTNPFPDSAAGETGAFAYLLAKTATSVFQLFENPIELAEGTSIEVIEELYLELQVTDEKLIDRDLTWFGDKEYLGTYRIYRESQVVSVYVDPENEGFITNRNFYLRRTKNYLVAGDLLGKPKDFGQLVLDKCSFSLIPTAIIPAAPFPPVPVPGFQPGNPIALMRGTLGGRNYPLGVGVLEYEISSVGLYLRPGVAFSTGRRETRIGGQVRSTRPEVTRSVTCGLASDECALREAAFFTGGLGGVSRTYAEVVEAVLSSPGYGTGTGELLSFISLGVYDLGSGCIAEGYALNIELG